MRSKRVKNKNIGLTDREKWNMTRFRRLPMKVLQDSLPLSNPVMPISTPDKQLTIGFDESRNPSFNGRYEHYTVAAVTVRNPDALKELLGPALHTYGRVKYSELKRVDREELYRILEGIGDAEPTIYIDVYMKNLQPEYVRRFPSREIMFNALDAMIERVKGPSSYNNIMLFVDKCEFIKDYDINLLSHNGVDVFQQKDEKSIYVMLADLAAGAFADALNEKGKESGIDNRDYFRPYETLKGVRKNVEPYQDTQSMYGGIHNYRNTNKNIKASKPKKKLFGKRRSAS